ncbi:MAG: hypothetical protein GY765_29315 [bacterium]|nr:hypothetical protein [bacterium]
MKYKLLLLSAGLILAFFIAILPGCNAAENLTNSSTLLIVETITGKDLDGNVGSTTIFADVITSGGTIVNDTASASLTARLLNPLGTDNTYYQDLIVDQVDVEYSRTDGLNVEGRDVPYKFSQAVHSRVSIGNTASLSFVLVQHNAKAESPLIELQNYGHEQVLKLEAKITFYARDLGGNRVAPAVGYISVWFANFGDSDT